MAHVFHNERSSGLFSRDDIFLTIIKTRQYVFKWRLLSFNLTILPYIMVAAIMGGYLGTLINQHLTNQRIEQLYNTLMVVLMLVSAINIYQTF
ncbi:hypothetical protein [Fundicoccus ignavus]|uniref:hypothetical protein n=1 Tax=Fundicoccus ignavus TaxID=2664442 RepID=UPI0031B6511E